MMDATLIRNFSTSSTPYSSLMLYFDLEMDKWCAVIQIVEETMKFQQRTGKNNKRILVVTTEKKQSKWKQHLMDSDPEFLSYVQFINYIHAVKNRGVQLDTSKDTKQKMSKRNIRHNFKNRLVILDEVHYNVTNTEIGTNKEIEKLLKEIATTHTENLRFLLLSTTTLYNSYREIVWLVNFMLVHDNRPEITENQLFASNAGDWTEDGKGLLSKKLNGYVCYVRNKNNKDLISLRLYPSLFQPTKSIIHPSVNKYPLTQWNGKAIKKPLQYIDVYPIEAGEVQERVYSRFIQHLQSQNIQGWEENDSFGYTLLQAPIQASVISFPSIDDHNGDCLGSKGLRNVMNFRNMSSTSPERADFTYKPNREKMFAYENIGKYSGKIKSICDSILSSEGIILVYSQYLDGGLVPLALALEELGMERGGNQPCLFHPSSSNSLPSSTSLPAYGQKYILISGDKFLSPDNETEICYACSNEIKVILLSSQVECAELKCIVRQIHVLEPWYNMNRIEEVIHRGIQYESHHELPVKIYLYATVFRNLPESVDLYLYRMAEKKTIQIGQVMQLLKKEVGSTGNDNKTLKQKLRDIFEEHTELTRDQIIVMINQTVITPYSYETIMFAMAEIIHNPLLEECVLVDAYGRRGRVIQHGSKYTFQPDEDETIETV